MPRPMPDAAPTALPTPNARHPRDARKPATAAAPNHCERGLGESAKRRPMTEPDNTPASPQTPTATSGGHAGAKRHTASAAATGPTPHHKPLDNHGKPSLNPPSEGGRQAPDDGGKNQGAGHGARLPRAHHGNRHDDEAHSERRAQTNTFVGAVSALKQSSLKHGASATDHEGVRAPAGDACARRPARRLGSCRQEAPGDPVLTTPQPPREAPASRRCRRRTVLVFERRLAVRCHPLGSRGVAPASGDGCGSRRPRCRRPTPRRLDPCRNPRCGQRPFSLSRWRRCSALTLIGR